MCIYNKKPIDRVCNPYHNTPRPQHCVSISPKIADTLYALVCATGVGLLYVYTTTCMQRPAYTQMNREKNLDYCLKAGSCIVAEDIARRTGFSWFASRACNYK